jgi:hypothetical protein
MTSGPNTTPRTQQPEQPFSSAAYGANDPKGAAPSGSSPLAQRPGGYPLGKVSAILLGWADRPSIRNDPFSECTILPLVVP